MRKALSVLGVFILGVVCACILAFEPVKTHVATELQHYRITTKVDALTEIYSAKYWNDSVGAKEVTAFPQIDLETIEPDQYEDALSTAQSCVETAKADVESALADFNERVKTHNFVSNQLSRVKKANAPVQTLDDALVYTDRMKAIILSQNKLSALELQTEQMMRISQDMYWDAVGHYVNVTFQARYIETEIQTRIAEYEKEQEAQRQLAAEMTWAGVPAGAAGRLRIPQYGISIPLYASMAQSTVDAPNSAAWFSYNGVMVIGDHWNQNGFSAVRGMAVGTRVYIDNQDGTTSNYTVTWSGTGVNASTQLLFSDGSNVDGRYGGLVLYTCLSDWQNVAIVCCG